MVESNRAAKAARAKARMRYDKLERADSDRIMRGDTRTKPTVSDLLDKENRRGVTSQPGPSNAEPDVNLTPGLGGPLPAPGCCCGRAASTGGAGRPRPNRPRGGVTCACVGQISSRR